MIAWLHFLSGTAMGRYLGRQAGADDIERSYAFAVLRPLVGAVGARRALSIEYNFQDDPSGAANIAENRIDLAKRDRSDVGA
jgi:hypothetical protein